MNEPIIKRYPIDCIRPGPNAREDFDEEELLELGESMKETTEPLQPLVGVPDADGRTIELIAGERRWRAGKLVGMPELPVLHRERPSEAEWLKWNLIENLQRVNLKPLETARAVCRALSFRDDSGTPIYSTHSLAAELKKPHFFVIHCSNLLKGPSELQTMVNAGKVNLEVGAMIGALPATLHERAMEEMILRPHFGPMDRDQARQHIKEYRRDLSKASFDQEDATLVADTPACQQCPNWGGNRADVEGKNRTRVCLNPVCFETKQRAAAELLRKHAENDKNMVVLAEADSSRLFESWNGDALAPESGYVELSKTPDPWALKDARAKMPKWDQLLKDQEVKIVVAFDSLGQQRRLVETKTALSAAKLNADHGDKFKDDAGVDLQTADEKKQADAIKKAGNVAARAKLVEGCSDLVSQIDGAMSDRERLPEILKIMFRMVRSRNVQRDDAELLCRVLQPALKKVSSPIDTLEQLVARETQERRLTAIMLLAMLIRGIRFNMCFELSASDMEDLARAVGFDSLRWNKEIDHERQAAEHAAKDTGGKKGKKKAKVGVKAKGRQCAHCKEFINAGSEEAFFEHVEGCSKRTPLRQQTSSSEGGSDDWAGKVAQLTKDEPPVKRERAVKGPPKKIGGKKLKKLLKGEVPKPPKPPKVKKKAAPARPKPVKGKLKKK